MALSDWTLMWITARRTLNVNEIVNTSIASWGSDGSIATSLYAEIRKFVFAR